jgi:hypothetical protein
MVIGMRPDMQGPLPVLAISRRSLLASTALA